MDQETFESRMIDFREINKVMIEYLIEIVQGLPANEWFDGPKRYPSHAERIKAVDTIMKLKRSALFTEEQILAIRQPTVTEKLTFDPRSGKKSLTKKWVRVMPGVRPILKNESN